MKNSKISLKWQLFIVILMFAGVITGIFVVFQIGLLETFYSYNKINRTNEMITEISEYVNNQELSVFSSDDNDLVTMLEELYSKEEMAVYLYANPIDEVNNPVYITNKGGSFDKLDNITIKSIWTKGADAHLKMFYAILSVNPDPMHKIQVLDIGTSKKQLTRDLSSLDDSIMCCSFVKLKDGNQYLLILDNKITPVDSAVATLKLQLAYIATIVIILTLIIAVVISRVISKPLQKMSIAAKELATGNYDIVFEGGGFKEIDVLSDTLNNTTMELAKTETLRRELMANVSHDLRTPLTMITGYAEMMKDLPGENNPENLQIIVDEANRLNILVNDMLDLSRLSSKTIELHPQIYCITDNLIDIVDRFNKFNDNEIEFKLFYKESVDVVADESKIDQVIYNFINNAINYSNNSKTVEIVQSIEKDMVKISVIDHGIGIKEEDLAIIWDRYYRVDKGHKRSIQGSGLGLSIVKGILEYHNFEYGVESKEGKGSTFWFKMPIKK